MNIRKSESNELDAIHALHVDGFGEDEGEMIAQLACDILNDESAEPLLSLVAVEDEKIIGHIIFSTMKIEGNEEVSAYILAPLAVAKTNQKQGIGTQLIEKGLAELKARGGELVFVLGDPNYYGRMGFAAGHLISAPYDLEYPEAWIAQELETDVLSKLKGVAKCCSSLMRWDYW